MRKKRKLKPVKTNLLLKRLHLVKDHPLEDQLSVEERLPEQANLLVDQTSPQD